MARFSLAAGGRQVGNATISSFPNFSLDVFLIIRNNDSSPALASGEYKNISFIHEIADSAVNDVTAEIMAETTLPEIPTTGADLQASGFDHVRDLRKHEAV